MMGNGCMCGPMALCAGRRGNEVSMVWCGVLIEIYQDSGGKVGDEGYAYDFGIGRSVDSVGVRLFLL